MKEQVPALWMIGLHKAFGETVAVDHVDLTVPAGSFFGLVGPNGAGKTTGLSMAVGLLRLDAGRSEVLGVDVQADPTRARQLMGVLPDGLALPERLTGRELLTLIGEMRRMDPDVIIERSQDLLDGPSTVRTTPAPCPAARLHRAPASRQPRARARSPRRRERASRALGRPPDIANATANGQDMFSELSN
jgi:energy-coupling factor transporter ATP-binding protein EcfA2